MPMKNGQHGITTQTLENIFVDAGKVMLNYGETGTERALGATMGGNSFTVEAEIKDIRPDGARGPVKGGRRITEVMVKLVVNLFEITKENLLAALPGSTATPYPAETGSTHDSITRAGNIKDTDYFKNIALIGTITGKTNPVIIIVKNALVDGGFELGAEDKEEGTIELTFTGHFDPANMDNEPWEIRYPTL